MEDAPVASSGDVEWRLAVEPWLYRCPLQVWTGGDYMICISVDHKGESYDV